jgi:hypothetical protein
MNSLLKKCRNNFHSLRAAWMFLTAACVLSAILMADDRSPVKVLAETPPPDYSSYRQSYHLPFGNPKPVDFDHLVTLEARVSINGGPPLRLQVDTGSCGVIVGASDVPNIDPKAPAGEITYSSSGIELDGVWTPATVTFLDSKDASGNMATAFVPVLAVNERKVHPGAVNGGKVKPSKNPKSFMMGIGTGRGFESHQDRNPWVNLKEMQAGTMRRGYTITRNGITLGLTNDSVGPGYLFEKLQPHIGTSTTAPTASGAPKDWDSSTGWVTVAGVKKPEAQMLLDTGLTNMMIVSPNETDLTEVGEGTDITVNLLAGKLHYDFKVGDKNNPATPKKVTFVNRPHSLVNTGLKVLALYDYLYDDDGGYIGLRPVGK